MTDHHCPADVIDAVLAALVGRRTPTDDIAVLVVEATLVSPSLRHAEP